MAKTRGIVTFVFDDGYEKVHANVLPILRNYGVPAVFALPLETKHLEEETREKIRPWQDWLHVTEDGCEIAAHSISHIDLKTQSPQQLNEELRKPADTLHATTLVYPGGGFNEVVLEQAKKYYSAARTVQHGYESVPPKNPMQLHTYNFTKNNFSVMKANMLALWACITNSWLIETYHMIDDKESPLLHSVSMKDFAKHVTFTTALPIRIATIRDVVTL